MQYAGRRGGSSHGRWHRCCGQRPSIVSPGGAAGGWALHGGPGRDPAAAGLGLGAGWRGTRGGGGGASPGLGEHPALLGLRRGAGCCPLTPREQGCDELSG